MISVIIPVLNEIQHDYLEKILELLSQTDFQVIVVDGGSSDGTQDLVKRYDVELHILKNSNRAERFNEGLKYVKGDVVLLHHPRSILTKEGLKNLENLKSFVWGGFKHSFDEKGIFYSFTSWYSNYIRFRLKKIIYLDHCIFVKTEILKKVGGVPPLDIFEDTALSEKLRKIANPIFLDYKSATSAVRFKKRGFFSQSFMNAKLKWQYARKRDDRKMNIYYESDFQFNKRN